MRTMTLEVIRVSRTKHPALIVYRDLQTTRQNYPTFFAFVRERYQSSVGAWLISLHQYLKRSSQQVVANLTVRDPSFPNFN